MNQKIRKVVIPAAGFGTRFLPQTKAMPKEMLPIVDKPVIQYVVEEAVASGIEDVVIVTGASKRAIEDHFDLPNADLVNNLIAGHKEKLLHDLQRIAEMANFIYVRQKGLYGNGTPVLSAEPIIGNDNFAVYHRPDAGAPYALELLYPLVNLKPPFLRLYEKGGADGMI